jgi:hypothetical protein
LSAARAAEASFGPRVGQCARVDAQFETRMRGLRVALRELPGDLPRQRVRDTLRLVHPAVLLHG